MFSFFSYARGFFKKRLRMRPQLESMRRWIGLEYRTLYSYV